MTIARVKTTWFFPSQPGPRGGRKASSGVYSTKSLTLAHDRTRATCVEAGGYAITVAESDLFSLCGIPSREIKVLAEEGDLKAYNEYMRSKRASERAAK